MAEKRVIDLEVNSNIPEVTDDVKALNKESVKVTESGKKLNETIDKTGGKTGGLKGIAKGMGEISPAMNGVTQAGLGVVKMMWAIVTNPIGAIIVAIVGAITLLYKAFTSTKEGADQLDQVLAGLSAVVDVLRDRVLTAFSAITKFFQGDFKGAMNEAKKTVKGLADEMVSEFNRAAKATKVLQQVEDATNRLSVSRAKVNRDLAVSKELLTDENATFEQKRKALDAIRIAEGRQTEQELKNAQRKVKAIKELNALSDTSREDKKKEQEAEAELFALQEKSAADRRAINKQEKLLRKQEAEAAKERAEANKQAQEARRQQAQETYKKEKDLLDESLKQEGLNFEQRRKIINDNTKINAADRKKLLDEINKEEKKTIEDHNRVIAALNQRYDNEALDRQADTAVKKQELDYQRRLAEIESVAQTEAEKLTLIEKLNTEHSVKMLAAKISDAEKEAAAKKVIRDKELADEKAAADATIAIRAANIANVDAGINLLKTIFEKNKGIQKALLVAESASSIAKIILNTKAANAAATLKYALLPGGIALAAAEKTANNISAGLGIGASIAATAKALSAMGGGSAPQGNIGNDAGGGGATAQAPAFNVVGSSGINQLAQLNAQPFQAFVVSSEVTTAQSLDRNRIQNATF
jgi:hypothetical protein